MRFHVSKIVLLIGTLPGLSVAGPGVDPQPGTWTALTHQPCFLASRSLLLTDGTVMSQEAETNRWYRLTPDRHGSYVDGTWSEAASLPSDYAPDLYNSAVLADGRMIIAGGSSTPQAAIYDPKADAWTVLGLPAGWTSVGFGPSVVLADKHWIIGDPDTSSMAKLDTETLQWTPLDSTGKSEINAEEGWTLLPNGTVLTVDVENIPNSERYFPLNDIWQNAGSTPLPLTDGSSNEMGPAILRPDGTVFVVGVCPLIEGNCYGSTHTAIYTPGLERSSEGVWQAGPDLPDSLDADVAPAAILPNGNVLLMTSPGASRNGAVFFEFDGTNLSEVAAPPDAASVGSSDGSMLVLPTGQVLLTTGTKDVEIYTPVNAHNKAWEPVVESSPYLVAEGGTYTLTGLRFNGLSNGAASGDVGQMSTNYPLVRFTNLLTHDVSYWRTHHHSTMGIATGEKKVSTDFDVPKMSGPAVGVLSVVANGIASEPRAVFVLPAAR